MKQQTSHVALSRQGGGSETSGVREAVGLLTVGCRGPALRCFLCVAALAVRRNASGLKDRPTARRQAGLVYKK